jgi:CO/xanthine dehydrogenase Mo-binding subunit
VNADVPDIETIVVEAPDRVTTPLGIKGIGELPAVGARWRSPTRSITGPA